MPNDAQDGFEVGFIEFLEKMLKSTDDSPVMVTGWVSMVEFIDNQGHPQMAAYSSLMPPWRLNGIIQEGQDMLTSDDYYYEDEDEFEDEDEE